MKSLPASPSLELPAKSGCSSKAVRAGDAVLYWCERRARAGRVTMIHDGFAQVRQPSGAMVAVLPQEIICHL